MLYRILNPKVGANATQIIEYDADRLLRVHWILFTHTAFASSDHVIDAIESEHHNHASSSVKLQKYIQSYLDSLIDVARLWVTIQDADHLPQDASPKIRFALNEFNRLNRLAELEPLIVAVLHRFGTSADDAAKFIRLCTILSFRDGLAKRRGNRGRSPKWTMARAVYQETLVDTQGEKITSVPDMAHHLFWKTGTWWSVEESKALTGNTDWDAAPSECASPSLVSSNFYQEFAQLLHYFFWEYGLVLGARKNDKLYGSQFVQANEFMNDKFWSEFRAQWDIEHVFPRKPDQQDAEEKRLLQKLRSHQNTMQQWLNHIGNLTVVPLGENRGLLSNSDFILKREAMLDRREVRFNELFRDSKYIGNLMDAPFWGPNNCRRRSEHLCQFANERWGTNAIRALGVGKEDKRVDFEGTVIDEEEDEIAR